MRLWSIHPRYLDARGLVALWRESLLAQSVLRGRTRGYRNHPQLDRFRARDEPVAWIAAYLRVVQVEAARRGYHFDRRRIARRPVPVGRIAVSRGQLELEWRHLVAKVRRRSPAEVPILPPTGRPSPHPVFRVVPGPAAEWERTSGG